MVIGTEATTTTTTTWRRKKKNPTDCSLTAADADIFIQLAQLTVIKENETLRLVCMGGGEKNKERGQESQFSHLFLINRRAVFSGFSTITHMYRRIRPVSRHAHEYLRRTEASFPALLYLMHIKYHFPEKIPQCLVFVGHREILS